MNDYYQLMKPFGPRIGHFVLNPDDFEKKKDIFSLYETEMEIYKQKAEDEEIKGYEDFEGIEEEWEDFNQSKTKNKNDN